MLTVNEHELVLPFPSLAKRVTVIEPAPLTGALIAGDWVTVMVVAQLSDTIARLV